MAGPEFDLFGNPVRDRKGQKGRPPFEVTDRIRNKVKLLLAMGWANERIANAIEVSLATLKRYFRAELKTRDAMRDRLDAERLMVVTERALDGVVGSQRLLGEMMEKNDRMEIDRRFASDKQVKEPSMGKKQIDANKALAADADLMAELDAEAGRNARH